MKPSAALAGAAGLEVVVDRVDRRSRPKRLVAGHRNRVAASGGVARLYAQRPATLVLQRGLGCPECAKALERGASGAVLATIAARRVPDLPRLRPHARHRSRQGVPDHELDARRRRDPPLARQVDEVGARRAVKLCKRHGVPMRRAVAERLPETQQKLILRGDGSWDDGMFPGVMGWFEWLETRTYKMHVRVLLSRYRSYDLCRDCGGKRLERTALSYRVGGLDLADWHALEIGDARATRRRARRRAPARASSRASELATRLGYLERVGPRLPHARSPGAHALGRRSAARDAHRGARHLAAQRAVRARRADGGPAPERRRAARPRCCASSPSATTSCSSSSTIRRDPRAPIA